MTSEGWLTSCDPAAMLELARSNVWPGLTPSGWSGLSGRKLRLYACACERDWWRGGAGMDGRTRASLQVAEAWADGALAADSREVRRFKRDSAEWMEDDAAAAASGVLQRRNSSADRPRQVALLRDVAGDPFRPVEAGVMCRPPLWHAPDALRGAVLGMAEKAYGERLPDFTLDPARLAVLADALEEAGLAGPVCPSCGPPVPPPRKRPPKWVDVLPAFWCGLCDERTHLLPSPLLSHLRSPGPHVRGCHVLDLILGRS